MKKLYDNFILSVKDFASFIFEKEKLPPKTHTKEKTWIGIPVYQRPSTPCPIPIHRTQYSQRIKLDIPPDIISHLGGHENIAAFNIIPNSRRIRITLHNPELIDKRKLSNNTVCFFMQVGERIIHIIP